MVRSYRWFGRCASIGAFMVPGLALWLPSGYSYGAALLLLAALASAPVWWKRPAPRRLVAAGRLFVHGRPVAA